MSPHNRRTEKFGPNRETFRAGSALEGVCHDSDYRTGVWTVGDLRSAIDRAPLKQPVEVWTTNTPGSRVTGNRAAYWAGRFHRLDTWTIGDLRSALAGVADDRPVRVWITSPFTEIPKGGDRG